MKFTVRQSLIFSFLLLIRADFNGRFYTRDALSVWDDFGQRYLVRLFRSSRIKMDTRRIIQLDELCCLMRLPRRTKAHNSSRRIMHLRHSSLEMVVNLNVCGWSCNCFGFGFSTVVLKPLYLWEKQDQPLSTYYGTSSPMILRTLAGFTTLQTLCDYGRLLSRQCSRRRD